MKTRGRNLQEDESNGAGNVSSGGEEVDAPEAVSWSASKDAVLRDIEKEKESIKSTKEREKQFRIQREERSRKLKAAKKAKELSRLPEEVLQKVAGQLKEDNVGFDAGGPDRDREHLTFDSDAEDNLEPTGGSVSTSNFSHDGISVVVLPKETRKPKKIEASAAAFLQQQLYGDRIPRLSTMKALSLKRKSCSRKPAVKFAKKCRNWLMGQN